MVSTSVGLTVSDCDAFCGLPLKHLFALNKIIIIIIIISLSLSLSLASKTAEKWRARYPLVATLLRWKMAMMRSALVCLRGSRSRYPRKVRPLEDAELVSSKLRVGFFDINVMLFFCYALVHGVCVIVFARLSSSAALRMLFNKL